MTAARAGLLLGRHLGRSTRFWTATALPSAISISIVLIRTISLSFQLWLGEAQVTIRSIAFEDAEVIGKEAVGVLIGIMNRISGARIRIIASSVTGSVTGGSGTFSGTGLFVGIATTGVNLAIESSYAQGTLTGGDNGAGGFIGGLGSTINIASSYAVVTFVDTTSGRTGGLVGASGCCFSYRPRLLLGQ